MNILEEFNKKQLKADIPDFAQGDDVVVQVKVKEGDRVRLQAYEGVVIAIKNRGLHSSFTVRKISHGEGVERVFQTHSPLIESIKVKRKGKVRRSKLYYLRGLTGKAARIKEKLASSATKASSANKKKTSTTKTSTTKKAVAKKATSSKKTVAKKATPK
tara:strand:+ start:239 stop:715 length:477 start_codon:yes stop_codon:yes gene_type:complete